MTENPYPLLSDRVGRIEERQDRLETSVTSLLSVTAVHGEQVATLKDDIRDLIQEMRDTNNSFSGRFDKLYKAIWGLVIMLIPTAVALFGIWYQGHV